MGITLEKIELVKDRTGASYKEASEALEHAGGSVVDAIIEIEEQAETEQSIRERVDKIDLEGEKKKLTFILDSIIEDPSIPLEKKVTLIVHTTSLICAVVAVQPIPFADIFVLSPIQLIMVTYLNKALGNPYEKSKMNEMLVSLLGVVGWGVLAQQLILGAYKAGLPYIAGVTTIPVVYAATWALGTGAKVIIEAKKNDIKVNDRELKKLVKRTKEEVKKEKKAVSISSVKRELLALNNDAKEFEKYKAQLEDMQEKLIELGIYDIEEKTKDEIILNTDISKVYQNRYNLIDKRIYSKYNNLAFSDQTKNLLALLPPRILLEEVEQVIGQINHDITRLNVYKPSESSNVREVITGFGNISLIIKGKIIYLQYIELNEEIKSGIILMDYIEAMNTSLNNRFLKDKEIREILVSTFEAAKEEVNIISPWANEKVMGSFTR